MQFGYLTGLFCVVACSGFGIIIGDKASPDRSPGDGAHARLFAAQYALFRPGARRHQYDLSVAVDLAERGK